MEGCHEKAMFASRMMLIIKLEISGGV